MNPFFLRKMPHQVQQSGAEGARSGLLHYTLGEVALNPLIGSTVTLEYTGLIECISCSRPIKKTFNQGHCFPCVRSLARCDSCIVRPELCHYAAGTCREPEWGETHCLIDHVVYLSNTTGLKVGVTGAHKVLERWGDQGAVQALVLARVPERLLAGQLEVELKKICNDKTDWRGLIKGVVGEVDLLESAAKINASIPEDFAQYLLSEDEQRASLHTFEFPVQQYPEKASTWNLDKTPTITGVLQGIRGQYLFIDGKGLNIRKYQGYQVNFTV